MINTTTKIPIKQKFQFALVENKIYQQRKVSKHKPYQTPRQTQNEQIPQTFLSQLQMIEQSQKSRSFEITH